MENHRSIKELAPIVLFVYNRSWHTMQTVESLQKNLLAQDSELFVFSDYARTRKEKANVSEVRNYLKGITGFKKVTIYEQERNKGLANSIIEGVTRIINIYGKAIVVEDDLLSSTDFLTFMNAALDFYQNDMRIFSVSGYTLPIDIPKNYPHEVYLSLRAYSWGWGTWRDRWETIDWNINKEELDMKTLKEFGQVGPDLPRMLLAQLDGKVNSWAVRFTYHSFRHHKFHLVPCVSRIHNIGLDNSGIHSKKTTKYNTVLNQDTKPVTFVKDLQVNDLIQERIRLFFRKNFFIRLAYKLLPGERWRFGGD